jgi:hypothetical protein
MSIIKGFLKFALGNMKGSWCLQFTIIQFLAAFRNLLLHIATGSFRNSFVVGLVAFEILKRNNPTR